MSSQDSVITHLQRRIGVDNRPIKATGKLERKYTHPKNADFNIEKYLTGNRYHIYGSSPLLADGKTYQIDCDFDEEWLDAHHKTFQQQLALSDIASIYAKRRPGRGHLVIPFASPVDPEAAYHAIVQASPVLASCKEIYPVGSQRTRKISWPFYHFRDGKVCESKLVAYSPQNPGIPIESPGLKSDRDGVERIFAIALNGGV